MPIAGGQDLLARMKDYVAQPDRIVNVKNALDATVDADAGRRAEDRRGGEDRRPGGARAGRQLYPAMALAAIEVGTPQIRNQGTVGGNLNQRPRCWYYRNEEFVCYKKGGNRVLLAGRREPVPRDLRRRPQPHRASLEPGRAVRRLRRDVPPRRAEGRADGRRPPTTSRCRRCRTCARRTCSPPTSC